VFLFITVNLSAQFQSFKTTQGRWKVIPYAVNVVKLVFTPVNYTRNENITAAVIEKPVLKNSVPVKLVEDAIVAGKEKKITIKPLLNKEGYNGFSITLNGNEKIFGGGERALPLNRRGYQFPLYNNPWYGYSNGADALNFSVPFFTSSNGYALFFDNASKGYADIGKTNTNVFEAGFVSGELNVYIIFGKDYKEILSSYYLLTGTQPLPPRWALGNFMSRFGYTNEAQTKTIAAKMKEEGIPFDAIIFDLFWFGDSIKRTMGNLDWVNKTAWPDPKKMIGDFKQQHINSVLIAEPFILENTKNYDAAKKYFAVDSAGHPFRLTDFYFGYGGLLDIFRKDAGNWIWNNHYKKQIANGVHAWWTDLGEPEKHPSSLMHNLKDLGVKRLMGADEVHNIYGHYWNKMLFENYAKEYPGQRLFHLNRSGFAGSQRYSIYPWSGDVSRSWSGLQAQLPLMLGMSMSGIPYIHADAGGFAGGEGDKELYVRWLQFAAFTPIFRPHGTALFEKDTAAYSFASEPALIDTPYKTYAKQVVKQRYSMLPYNYTLAYKQAKSGAPLVAPLYYYYPTDTAAVNISDEFMWGENILVAPVLEKGMKERKIYLPEGRWYKNNGFTAYEGAVTDQLKIESIPVYIKAGSFITTIQPSYFIVDSPVVKSDALNVAYYYDKKPSSGVLFFDDGESKTSIATGQYELISFDAVTTAGGLKIIIKSNGGNFNGKPKQRKIELQVKGFSRYKKKCYLNGKALGEFSNEPHQDPDNVFGLTFTGEPLIFELK
jgi:oligosaccharide 4-alpha-D-glucosyltransferase